MTSLHIPSEPMTCSAPCKVNLTLDVFAPRADGFHDLDSVVVPFASPADEVKVTLRAGPRSVRLICKSPDLPKGAENLAHRAASVFLDAFLPEDALTVYVKLEKRLPIKAGLGGGSSDAAAVLRALDSLLPGRADRESLARIAAGLGSDVPLFLFDGPVRMRGRGDIVEPLSEVLGPLWGVLVKPDAGVPTGPAYALLDALPSRVPGQATARLLDTLPSGPGDVEALGAALGNDFEAAILPAYPAVADAFAAVADVGAVRTLLCGSGAALFGLAHNREHAKEMTRQLAGRFPWVKMAQPAIIGASRGG